MTDSAEFETVMLHYGHNGPVEVEIWDEENEEATHVHVDYGDEKRSVDLSRKLRRAGYELRRVDDAE